MNIHQKVLEKIIESLEDRKKLLQKLIAQHKNNMKTDIGDAWTDARKQEIKYIEGELQYIYKALENIDE